jgi:E3 SUMO-protein ligase PIAS1
MKSKGIKPSDFTRGLIKEKLNEDGDSEIATTVLRVSLMCPLGKTRMQTPCRASTCTHLQCFDALLYLQMNELHPKWNCPVCDKEILFDNLVIDGYFLDVIRSLDVKTTEVQLHKDGTWTKLEDSAEEKKTKIAMAQKNVDILILDSDEDDDDDDDKKNNNKPSNLLIFLYFCIPNTHTLSLSLFSFLHS